MTSIVIDLENDLEATAFRFAVEEAIREIAGPGNEQYYRQLLLWREELENSLPA